MEWLIRHVGPVAKATVRAALPAVLVSVGAALVDVGLLDGRVYQAVALALSAL